MKNVILYFLGITLLIFSFPAIGQIDECYEENQKKAYAASTVEECQSSLQFCNQSIKDVPNHPVINYLQARLNAQMGNNEIAFNYLKKATQLGYTSNIRWLKIHPVLAIDAYKKMLTIDPSNWYYAYLIYQLENSL